MATMRRALRNLQPRALSTGAPSRAAYAHFYRATTRWNDNDMFGHMNNTIYYQFMDDAINAHLLANNIPYSFPRFVAESSCKYLRPLAYPTPVDVGLRVAKLGNSSATYDIGLFADGDDALAARGHWVHVYVDEQTGRPAPIAAEVRQVLDTLTLPGAEDA